ncbi:hypothetical protein G6O69_16855 [Pseudenhygromyxa sp. WMMC2535]|uniref:hypothetical protein n=1 Tax=Pseudenhygromyxa sp. WMMC2535 TaxID=2712867 RepID=UPI001552B0E7|nr:hypothetical protein [Pseudenhygromyxa sp. WMMC2535]NVB39514.1 hypothetical protein [Pseudenhygromyxa sp. WMMC2535]
MFAKFRSLVLAAPLFACMSCAIQPGDYVIYRVAFSESEAGADCGEPSDDVIDDESDFTTPTSMAIFAFDDVYFLEFGDDGMGGVTALEGTRSGSTYNFSGTSIDVTVINPDDDSKTTAEYTVEVELAINGKNINGVATTYSSTTCSGDSCPEDVYPYSCTSASRFRGSEVNDADLERTI